EPDGVRDWDGRGAPPAEEEPAGLDETRLMEHNAYFNPAGLSGAGVVNTARWREAEVPSANCHGSARGVARVYAALAAGGTIGGVQGPDHCAPADAVCEQAGRQDPGVPRPS